MGTEIEDHIVQKYEIKKRLGKGAYGIVWKVADKKTKQILALKKIFDAFRNRTDAQRTFREIMFLMAFGNHSNIIKLHNVLQAFNNKDIYLVFEFMETDLHNVIKKGDILQDIHMRFIMYQLFKALKYLHSGNVIHRDLKPSNVLLNSECHVKMCDFGLARSLSQIPVDEEGSPNLTEYIATRWYRAPEILLASHRYTSGIDQWSMGCILGEMFLGKPLFPGSSTLNQLERIMSVIDKPSPKDIESMQSDYGATVSETTSIVHRSLEEMFPSVEPNGFRMLKQLLQFNPDKRLSADQALKHSYLSKFHKPSEEIAMDHEVLPMLDDAVQLSLEEYRDKLYALISEGKLQLDWSEKKMIKKDDSAISNPSSTPATNKSIKEDEKLITSSGAKHSEVENSLDTNAKNVNKTCEDDTSEIVKEDNDDGDGETIRCDDQQFVEKGHNSHKSESAINENEIEEVTLRCSDEVSEKSESGKCIDASLSNSELINSVEKNEPTNENEHMENSKFIDPSTNSLDLNKSDAAIGIKTGHIVGSTSDLQDSSSATDGKQLKGSDTKLNTFNKSDKSKSTSVLHSKQHSIKADNHKLLSRDNSLNKDIDAKPRWVISTAKNRTNSYSKSVNDCSQANSNNTNNKNNNINNKPNIKTKKMSLKENNSESLNNLNRNISKARPVSGFKMLKEQNYSKMINKVNNIENFNQKSHPDDNLTRQKNDISQSQFHPLLRTKKYAYYPNNPSIEKTAKNSTLTKNTTKSDNEKTEDKKWATFKLVARPKSRTTPPVKGFNANISIGNPDAKPPRPNPPRHTSAPAATKNFTALRIEPVTSSKFPLRRNRAVSSHVHRNIDHKITNETATIFTKPPRFLPSIKSNNMAIKERWVTKPA